ncbi:MAG: hypothetical protein HRU75_05000 [Planctomycetia bacterium]|nr:MAG: hypothetical protein HRU75_05000 [Planctomycetia bacterium]
MAWAAGRMAATYEYDPYGNTVSKSGTYADTNPFRFSTKFFDPETGLYYYGYRYYSPRLGRWISRDPMSMITAGRDYVSFDNNTVIKVDARGLESGALPPQPPPRKHAGECVRDYHTNKRLCLWIYMIDPPGYATCMRDAGSYFELCLDASRDAAGCHTAATRTHDDCDYPRNHTYSGRRFCLTDRCSVFVRVARCGFLLHAVVDDKEVDDGKRLDKRRRATWPAL